MSYEHGMAWKPRLTTFESRKCGSKPSTADAYATLLVVRPGQESRHCTTYSQPALQGEQGGPDPNLQPCLLGASRHLRPGIIVTP